MVFSPSAGADEALGPFVFRVMIYIHIVDLESVMLHTRFQDHRPLGSGEEDF